MPEVEPAARSAWRKSTRSGATGACVEVAVLPAVVLVRDSKDADGPRLRLQRPAFSAFVADVATGRLPR